MQFKQLLTLRIHEKNYHQDRTESNEAIFSDTLQEFTSNTAILVEETFAPALFPDQPPIPFTLFVPKDNTVLKSLIIHTHGGPDTYFSKSTLHAEIAYLLSHGYVIACPNYRGSSDYPETRGAQEKLQWLTWKEKSKGKYHIYGPEDVYAVTWFMQSMDYIDKNNTVLRGGSFGSFINAHLLAGIKKGKFKSIFAGAHLSGGMNYPVPSTLPNIPLLVSHGASDEQVPFEDALAFMKKLLQKQLASELDNNLLCGVETFIAKEGNHHLIHPDLKLRTFKSTARDELENYLQCAMQFIHNLSAKKPFKHTDHYEQYEITLSLPSAESILQEIYCYKEMEKLSICIKPVAPVPAIQHITTHYGPTVALLKIRLGSHFTGNIAQDLRCFFENQFAPISWQDKATVIHDAGLRILEDKECMNQLLAMIAQEEYFLEKNPDHMVMYHAADRNSLQLYCFIDLWLKMLQGIVPDNLEIIEEMRLFSLVKNSFQDINTFLKKMLVGKNRVDFFNYLPGFPERALSCNPSLISNTYTTASCSFWAYFTQASSINFEDKTWIISDFFNMLNIDSEMRLNRYLNLFQLYETENQSLMQQFFIPYETAKKRAYLCQIWGEPFAANSFNLQSPEQMKALIHNPFGFDAKMKNELHHVFTNFGGLPHFGEVEKGFSYTDLIQLRYIPEGPVPTFSYFKNPAFHQQFVQELSVLIREDFVDYLAYGCKIPKTMISNGENFRKNLYNTSSDLHFFKRNTKVNLESYYLQQVELRMNLVQDPSKERYGKIVQLARKDKKYLQERLKRNLDKNDVYNYDASVFTFALCKHLPGYTYYDVLHEAASNALQNYNTAPNDLQFFMKMVEQYATPVALEQYVMKTEEYQRIIMLVESIQSTRKFSEKIEFKIWSKELNHALNSFMRHITAAQDKAQGKTVDYDIIYCGTEKKVSFSS